MAGGGSYDQDLQRAERLRALAADLGMAGPVELAIRFGLSKPGVSTVLVGYSTLDHLEEAIRITEHGPLSAEALQRALALSAV
jgi:aryl-alcohol dehydrogenase-like predicted oxidoreductase